MTKVQADWYVIKTETGPCQIVQGHQIEAMEQSAKTQQWGPFTSQGEAIARRVGLIRSGKCTPI
ncbi:MAG: hypothetical protein QNJ46_11870 [Leptolyngbyaceae cyanobacterium MO_188.B28]|nr:hypothetical protein [Leptolyngbyaceae cyanobacterium MO_188.B28]